MADILIEPSGLAPLRVVREVERLVFKAAAAVEGHFGVPLPPVTVVVAGRVGMATASLMANGWRRGSVRARVAHWRDHFGQAREVFGFSMATRTDRVLVGLNGRALKADLEQVYPTLVHELVHAMQLDRPGRREERRADADRELGLVEHSWGYVVAMGAVKSLDEAEAYAVQHALCPGSVSSDGESFDVASVACRLENSVRQWTNAALSYQAV